MSRGMVALLTSDRRMIASFCLVALLLPGCAAYRFGSATMFRPGIRTVHVPIVRNDTFRLDLGVRLSEALVKEIESRTPYKVTGDPAMPYSDSISNLGVIQRGSSGSLTLIESK